jgi:hypothetical protein
MVQICSITTEVVVRMRNENSTFEKIKALFDNVCDVIKSYYASYNKNGTLQKGTIVEVVAKYSCLGCINDTLRNQTEVRHSRVDALYKECHRLAVNILVEELYYLLNQAGYKVAISTEAELEYGKADVLITITSYGLNLKGKTKELLVEVKTGNSLSLSQLFRYLLDGKSDKVVVWRVRKRQVLVFNAQKIEPLLIEFMKMICLRANRLLSSQIPSLCLHKKHLNYEPTQEELEKAFKEFSEALIETLPLVLQSILKELERILPQESKGE